MATFSFDVTSALLRLVGSPSQQTGYDRGACELQMAVHEGTVMIKVR